MTQTKRMEEKPIRSRDLQEAGMQVRVASINEGKCILTSFNRRDFYKITLVTKGTSQLHYIDGSIDINGPALVFTNPLVPYTWENSGAEPSGYFCVFTDDFLQAGNQLESLQRSNLFKPGGSPVYLLDKSQTDYIISIFSRMRDEIDSNYIYKYELIRTQVNLLLHEAVKMQSAIAGFNPQNAASRIATLFIGLLEKQFPVDSPQYTISLKKAGDYASRLSVHVNHLNAAVHETTGKSTTTHINERIIREATSLLLHTDWSVATIGFCLGFEYASYFNNFFKKHTGFTPMKLRIK